MKFFTLCALLLCIGAVSLHVSAPQDALASELILKAETIKRENPSDFFTQLLQFATELATGKIHTATAVDAKNVEEALSKANTKNIFLFINGNWTEENHHSQQFISVDPKSKATKLIPFLGYMNAMADILQVFTPEKFIPFTISSFPSDNSANFYTLAVFDLNNGYIYVNETAIAVLDNVDDDDLHKSYQKMTKHVQRQAEKIGDKKVAGYMELFEVFGLTLQELVLNPFIKCVVCIIVLANFLPLVANYIIVNLAVYLCQLLKLAPHTCTRFWMSSMNLVLVLLPVIAYAIFITCGLKQHCKVQHTVIKAAKLFF